MILINNDHNTKDNKPEQHNSLRKGKGKRGGKNTQKTHEWMIVKKQTNKRINIAMNNNKEGRKEV